MILIVIGWAVRVVFELFFKFGYIFVLNSNSKFKLSLKYLDLQSNIGF